MTALRRALAVAVLLLTASCTRVHRSGLGIGPWRPPLALAAGGATPYVITLADTATPPERNAAGELAAYLGRVTGATFAVVSPAAGADRPALAVGPGAAKALLPDLALARTGADGLGEDGIVIRRAGRSLILSGAEGAQRGTLYAVYEFLERDVGLRWWTPTAEAVPSRPSLVVNPAPVRYVPPFLYRETLCGALRPHVWEKAEEVPLFAVRLRQNGHFVKIPAAWGGHYTLIGWCHTFEHLLPPGRYFKDHPEWYSELNGTRTHAKAQLCLTNEDMLAELSRNVLAAIRQDPGAGMISVAQNDWGGNCRCERCRALDEAEGSPAGSLLHGVNRVAEAVEKEFPGFLVETLAYQYTRKPPKTVRPRRNVIVRLAVIERSAVQPIASAVNRSLHEDLQAWSAVAPNLYLWDYTANLLHPFTPEPRALVYGPDLRLYRDKGAISVFCEHSHGSSPISDFDELHTWLLSKLLWNPDQDEHALVREFLDGYYGPAGSALAEYQDLLAGRIGNLKVPSWSGPRIADWLDLASMNRATELFDAAAAAVAPDPMLTARVRRARISLDHQWLCGQAGYRYLSERQGQPYRGPTDMAALLADLTSRCREAGVGQIGYGKGESLDDYLLNSRRVGERVPGRLSLATDAPYQAFLRGAPVPLPPELAEVPRRRVVDLHEDRMDLFDGAEIAFDAQAANHGAARIDPATLSWAVQARDLATRGIRGRWHAYAVVRVEATGQTGVAFTAGVYDSSSNRNRVGVSQRLEGRPGGTPDPNVASDQTTALDEPVTDGRYRLYDFGVHEFSGDTYLWVGTTGGVDPKVVQAIWVDRFVFVRE